VRGKLTLIKEINMANFKLIQVSDTHLSRERPYFVPNWDAMVAHVNAAQPDMLLNTGDIALNGENMPDDLAFAAEQHRRLTVPVHAIPGNHDIGDNPSPNSHGAGISDPRREIYRSHFGAEQWTMAAGDWYFIALNAQLLGSGLPAEAAQWAFLEQAFSTAGERPVALFLHKPLFRDTPDETHEAAGRYVLREPRMQLLSLMRAGQGSPRCLRPCAPASDVRARRCVPCLGALHSVYSARRIPAPNRHQGGGPGGVRF
jgi:3',5'-cyclic AMP phosphodiesterase CpdA